jgi:hypothetical protein
VVAFGADRWPCRSDVPSISATTDKACCQAANALAAIGESMVVDVDPGVAEEVVVVVESPTEEP